MTAEITTLYASPGEGIFYCPYILRLTGGRSVRQLARHPSGAHLLPDGSPLDCAAHQVWTFSWRAGDYHIEHPANGGVPVCWCGERLVGVDGQDPGHRR
jgi:hypothetical protein